MKELRTDVVAEPPAISALTEHAAAFLAVGGVDARTAHHVTLVLEEVLMNTAMHGQAGTRPATVFIQVMPDRVDAEILDSGVAFDPRTAAEPDLSAGIKERPIGGLGLVLVRRVTDELAYERVGGKNRTTFSIKRNLNEGGGHGQGQ